MQHCLRERRTVNRVDLVESLADVARALARLHAEGHIHRDGACASLLLGLNRCFSQLTRVGGNEPLCSVKARNVLVSADYATAKLADFGLARPLVREGGGGSGGASGGGGMTPRVGPRKYRAPEVEAGAQYGTAVDVFSYGVMVGEARGYCFKPPGGLCLVCHFPLSPGFERGLARWWRS